MNAYQITLTLPHTYSQEPVTNTVDAEDPATAEVIARYRASEKTGFRVDVLAFEFRDCQRVWVRS